MSVRRKAFFAFLLLWVSFLAVMIAGTFDFRFVLYGGATLTFGFVVYTCTLRCPNCGQWIYKRRKKLWGMEAIYYGGNPVPRRCSWCGQDLSQTTMGTSSVHKPNAV
jgi:hypothetical protein